MDKTSLLRAIAEGFQKTPWEAFISLIIITALLVLAFMVSHIYKFVILNQSNKKWTSEYNLLIRKLNLTINELDLIDDLSVFLVNPIRKILLLKNRNTFNHAISKLQKGKGLNLKNHDILIKKIFGDEIENVPFQSEKLFGPKRPVSFVNTDGKVYSGRLSSRDGNKVSISEVKQVSQKENVESGSLLIQDFRGIHSHAVSKVESPDLNTFQLTISKTPIEGKDQTQISSAFIILPDSKSPIQTKIRLLSNESAIMEIPHGQLKIHQDIKVSIRTSITANYWVNATVTGISLNKRYAKLKFGYVK